LTSVDQIYSFPQISEFPELLNTAGWDWEQYDTPSIYTKKFWIGTDLNGYKWLAKLKGDFYGYREIVFARLAQKMGWCCQTSVFAKIDKESTRVLNIDDKFQIQAVHLFLDKHVPEQCSAHCPFPLISNNEQIMKEIKKGINTCFLNLLRAEYSSILFGAGESSEVLLTESDEIVIIDNEQMFSSPIQKDNPLYHPKWDNFDDRDLIDAVNYIKNGMFKDIVGLTEEDILNSLKIPLGVCVDKKWPLKDRIVACQQYSSYQLSLY
jgi:hypothetical protein